MIELRDEIVDSLRHVAPALMQIERLLLEFPNLPRAALALLAEAPVLTCEPVESLDERTDCTLETIELAPTA